MDSFEFADSRTKRIHQKLSNQNAKEYGAYLEKIMNIPFDFGENRISNDLLISLDCFQAVEIYSRANKKKLRRIFANFIKLNAQKKEKYNSLIDDAEKSIRSLVDQTDLSYKTWMKDYRMSYNSKYLSTIDISLDSVGPSLFRIIYNFYLSDLARYKYWMYSCPEVKNELKIKRKIRINGISLIFHRKTGNQRKKDEIGNLEKAIIKEINRFIKKNAPGILYKTYKTTPCTLIATLTENRRIFRYGKNVFSETDNVPNFWQNIINSDANHDRYYIDEKYHNIFVPASENGENSDIYI